MLNRQQRAEELDDLEAVIVKDRENPHVQIPWPEQDQEDPLGYKKPLQKLGLKAIKYKDGTLELVGDYAP